MYAKLYGYNTGYQTLYMVADLKLGQYAKVPPRSTFVAQLSGAIIGAIFNYILYKSIVGAHREDLQKSNRHATVVGLNAQQINSRGYNLGGVGKGTLCPGKRFTSRSDAAVLAQNIECIKAIDKASIRAPIWISGTFPAIFHASSISKVNASTRVRICNVFQQISSQRIWSYLNMPVILTYVGWLPYSVNGAPVLKILTYQSC
ncbi:OPT oligopeptide transporter protein-domain-containing protein [Pisolithus croceorrhizus]|nr:OPT oligopeptide transporter protein-domain-containing protein [Pisolithus croceorrhizus]